MIGLKPGTTKVSIICLCFSMIIFFSISFGNASEETGFILFLNQSDSQNDPPNSTISGIDTPIRIENNTICGPTGYNFPGVGSELNPFRIENKTISTKVGIGIYIRDTSVHILIQNCTIEAPNYSSIHLLELYGGSIIIRNNTLFSSTSGIRAQYFDAHCKILNNTIRNNYNGISTFHIDSTLIANNTLEDNQNYGMQVRSSSNCKIENNTLSNGKFDLVIQSMSACSVINNTFAEKGIYIDVTSQGAYNSITIEDNWVNGKEIKYLYDESNLILEDSLGQIILAWCSNIQISNIDFPNTSFPVVLDSCSDCIVENNTIQGSYYGVYVCSSDDVLVKNNDILQCESEGIRFSYGGFDNVISLNRIEQNPFGIYSYWIGGRLEVKNNIINQSDVGITIFGRDENSAFLDIEENGIFLSTSWGIRVGTFTDVEISYNSVCNNGFIGVFLSEIHNSRIHHNLIRENNDYGLRIDSGSNNRIHHNRFENNYPVAISQAYDAGISNIWYDTLFKEGNYWSNYDHSGYYEIDGPSNSVDLYPNNWEKSPIPTENSAVNLLMVIISFTSLTLLCSRVFRRKSLNRT